MTKNLVYTFTFLKLFGNSVYKMLTFNGFIGEKTMIKINYQYRMLTVVGSASRKPNTFLSLKNSLPDIDVIYLYVIFEEKYELLINTSESVALKHCNDPKDFMEYSTVMGDIYERIDQ